MNIDLAPIRYLFINKPILFAGKAMEYYGLRKAGDDIDFIVSYEDFANLRIIYPNNIKTIDNDLGIIIGIFEVWKTLFNHNYAFLSDGAIEESDYKVVSLEKLLLLKKASKPTEKNLHDIELIEEKLK